MRSGSAQAGRFGGPSGVVAMSVTTAALLFASAGSSSAAGRLEGIRSSAEADSTRVILDLSEVHSFRYGMVPSDAQKGLPARLYVDIDGIKLDRARKWELWVGDQRVKQVRAGQNTLQKARVVLELEGAVKPTVFALQSPPRIIIELQGTGTATRGAPVVARATPPPAAPVAPAAPKAPSPSRAASSFAAPAVPRFGGTDRTAVRKVRIVIDAGHGGKDPGARGYAGSEEKDGALDISQRLARKLSDRLGFQVLMTRQSDKFVALSDRKDMANRVDADLFVSVHLNASKNQRLNGIETYYLKNSNDRATLRLATMENGVDEMIHGDVSSDADLSYILSDIIQGQKEAHSIRAAQHIQDSLVAHLKPRYSPVASLGVKQGPFLVLDGTYMPSVLVEAGFISHSVEGKRLMSSAYRDAVAEGLYQGIKRYFEDDRTAQAR